MDKFFAYIFRQQILMEQRNTTYRTADFCLPTKDFMDHMCLMDFAHNMYIHLFFCY